MQTLDAIFDAYATILNAMDTACEETKKKIPIIPCKKFCDDCCRQIFPISLVEAYYLFIGLTRADRTLRRFLTQRAEKVYQKIAKEPWHALQVINGTRSEVNEKRNKLSITLKAMCTPCPVLKDNLCALYDYRNPDSRLHGFSFNTEDNVILGCFRFLAPQFQTSAVKRDLLDFAMQQKEKQKLDQTLQSMLTAGAVPKTVTYVTSIFQPLLRDYRATDWAAFFRKKFQNKPPREDAYSLIVDMQP